METNKLTCCDLMIGDWVLYDPNVFIEDEYEPHKEPYPCRIESGEQIDDAVNECYFPIPLTAEILEKNGFKNIDTGLDCDGSNIYWKTNNGYSINTQDINLNFVHELQHALRLCGINDKEIVL